MPYLPVGLIASLNLKERTIRAIVQRVSASVAFHDVEGDSQSAMITLRGRMLKEIEGCPSWDVQSAKDRDLYFYLEQIEAYVSPTRVRVTGHGEMLMLGGYSYLGLNGHSRINEAARKAIEQYGTGTHGVRLLAGTLDIHSQLERRVAFFVTAESAVTFSSGYIANVSTIAALSGRHDTIVCDKLDHASIIDGCRLSGARCRRYQHNDMDDLERCLQSASSRHNTIVAVDAVFSMDGDIVKFAEVTQLCRQYRATLLIDEAHSLGVLGDTGRGIEEHFGLTDGRLDMIKTGTLSKAIPSLGGYAAGSRKLCERLSHHARGFVYSASLSPPAAAAAIAALDVIVEEPERVQRLHANIGYFGECLSSIGVENVDENTPIFPIACPSDTYALKLARHCQRRGVFIQAIIPPVVRPNGARLRAAISAVHTIDEMEFATGVLREGLAACAESPLEQ